MDQRQLIAAIAESFAEDTALRGLFLSGSFGSGRADAWSDVDLLAVLAPDDFAPFEERWREALQAIMPVVFWNRIDSPMPVLNAVTEDWTRCDIQLAPNAIPPRKAQDTLKPLIDRGSLLDALPATLPPVEPSRGKVVWMVNEFIRVLGLTHVGVGREEWVTCTRGATILRDLLIDLMVEAHALVDPGGILHLKRNLDADEMALLAALPPLSATRQSILDYNAAATRLFLPRARALMARLGAPWPQAFEDATRTIVAPLIGGAAFDTEGGDNPVASSPAQRK